MVRSNDKIRNGWCMQLWGQDRRGLMAIKFIPVPLVSGMLNGMRLRGCGSGPPQVAISIVEFSDRRYAGNSDKEVLHASLLASRQPRSK